MRNNRIIFVCLFEKGTLTPVWVIQTHLHQGGSSGYGEEEINKRDIHKVKYKRLGDWWDRVGGEKTRSLECLEFVAWVAGWIVVPAQTEGMPKDKH